ncbi:hypothetical protein H4R33_005173 [Dimargaris cristalligena]|uniref:Pyrroline-5-carboxylate reductase dimerization-domain-containing protein n=1 Tax=Dimargaris cristalligena TaxID=215637 RepID=A0A4P9ZTE1_9FUNG|nr:hypothetical protein H4R33_005173 [Dimargaris cristalligena]RKP36783.1 pyrroline-5-carboxylate reductase dimerization-domain-containing protein [Dimargaris cristalligena]|eukprot:RKP36783.1 pyrroline-5-carboxylate reductase dimerization-domain-containing protein [Dimargaris cristalligena]
MPAANSATAPSSNTPTATAAASQGSSATAISKSKIITFIGGGNMAEAILGGLIAQGYLPENLRVSDPIAERCVYMHTKYRVPVYTDNPAALCGQPGASPAGCASSYPTDGRSSDIIILAVKPQVTQLVLAPLGAELTQTQPLLISIVAGIRIADLLRWIKPAVPQNTPANLPPVVRCMPNTPALVGQGASGLFADSRVSETQRAMTCEILGAVSKVFWVDQENLIDAVTAVSGSGPAYFFLMLEAMQQGGLAAGLSSQMAAELAAQTCLGAATMILNSSDSAAELRRKVTSPKGTTEAAINTMIAGGLKEAVVGGVMAADRRSKELADILGQQ